MKKSLYDVLGVPEGATNEEIKRAFREKAKKLHPDVAQSEDCNYFPLLVLAYRVLSDTSRRAVYDDTGITEDVSKKEYGIARDALCQKLLGVMQQNPLSELKYKNLIVMIRKLIEEELAQCKEQRKKCDFNKAGLEELAWRFSTAGSAPNFFKSTVLQQVKGASAQLFNVDLHIRSCELQLKMLESCRFRVEMKNMIHGRMWKYQMGSTFATSTY